MDDEELLAGNDAREQDRHALAVFAAAVIERQEGAPLDELPALGRNVDGRGRLVVAAIEQREVVVVGTRQGLEGAAVLLGDAGAHGEPRVYGVVRRGPARVRGPSGIGWWSGRRGAGYAGARCGCGRGGGLRSVGRGGAWP